jgi:hypothetical protein
MTLEAKINILLLLDFYGRIAISRNESFHLEMLFAKAGLKDELVHGI